MATLFVVPNDYVRQRTDWIEWSGHDPGVRLSASGDPEITLPGGTTQHRSSKVDFDERRSVALSAAGRSNLTESGIDRALSSSFEPGPGAPMHAPGRARAHADSAVMIFSSHCSPRCARRQPALRRTVTLNERQSLN